MAVTRTVSPVKFTTADEFSDAKLCRGIFITYHNRYLAALGRAENCGDGIMVAALLDGALLHINKSSKAPWVIRNGVACRAPAMPHNQTAS